MPDPGFTEAQSALRRIVITICQPCLDGEGSECHTPGCALWMHAVDLPIDPSAYQDVEQVGWCRPNPSPLSPPWRMRMLHPDVDPPEGWTPAYRLTEEVSP